MGPQAVMNSQHLFGTPCCIEGTWPMLGEIRWEGNQNHQKLFLFLVFKMLYVCFTQTSVVKQRKLISVVIVLPAFMLKGKPLTHLGGDFINLKWHRFLFLTGISAQLASNPFWSPQLWFPLVHLVYTKHTRARAHLDTCLYPGVCFPFIKSGI